ncbi:MAG TPA: MFS transporter [Steroidobacteraceae bacterium]|nr:MFS transporter [Steroidobacteraceae bacterium]
MSSAGWGLAILSFINLFNYLDRFLVPALFESLKHSELQLTDAELGSLMSGFLAVYTLAAPVFGALGDRRSRPRLIAFGVGFWSLATSLSGFAGNYAGLLVARASVGIGEAAYATIAPSLLSDYFPVDRRGRVMAIFFCAIPVGSALGYVVGGLMNAHFGWRPAFFVAGIPGLALAILCLWLRDPPRGIQDAPPAARGGPTPGGTDANGAARAGGASPTAGTAHPPLAETRPPRNRSASNAPSDRCAAPASAAPAADRALDIKTTYQSLLRNRPYVFTVLGYAAYTFALGGLASWMPAFLERVRGMSPDTATVQFGEIVVITGFVGTFVGGWLGDYCAKYSKQAYLLVSAAATLVAAPFAWFALTVASSTEYIVCMVIAQLLMFLSTGPINACIVNIVLPNQRATAVALEVFAIHLLGDAISPFLIGAISDATSLGQALKIVPAAIVVSAVLWGWAAREQARVGEVNPTGASPES